MTGLSGVIAYSVLLRRREIGIRLALGADPRDVVSLIMKQGLLLTSAGMIIGLGLAFGLTKFLTSQIPGVRAFDLIVYGIVAGLICIL
ncbi:MAG: FtsX-like permease family protein, partial [Pyrinomonadaceae bacterium]